MPSFATPEQRTAQKRLVGIINSNRVITGAGLALWREDDSFYGSADADDVAADLAVLGVPSTITPCLMPPGAKERRARRGREVRIARTDLSGLYPWMPSLQKRVEEVPQDSPFPKFVVFIAAGEGMQIGTLALASLWPWWTPKAAERMGLTCADCGWDLRQDEDERRGAYRIPDRPAPGRVITLYCGDCCDHGLDALDRLASAPAPTAQP
jgi:hypothetical protein